jgi:uncharacterized protein (AIM24 family)
MTRIQLGANEEIHAESGAMVSMSDGITIKTKCPRAIANELMALFAALTPEQVLAKCKEG